MTMYSGQVTQLLQGVSQQHPKDRAEGQIGAQVNCISDVVEGLRRRPAIVALSELSGISTSFTLDDDTAIYSYSRGDGSEEYIMLFDTSGNVKIYDAFTGAEKTVTGTPETYLVSATPATSLRFHTIGDVTFVLNTEDVVEMEPFSLSGSLGNEAIIYCVRASYGHQYEVYIDGVQRATYTTPATVTVGSSTTINKQTTLSSSTVMSNLWAQLNSWGGLSGLTLKDDVLHIRKSADFQIMVADGNHGQDLKVIRNAVDSFEKLPKYAPREYKVEITGIGDEATDNYWVQWLPSSGSSVNWEGDGIWQECIAPTTLIAMKGSTLPHTITRNADGTFTVAQATWGSRLAGDDETNPQPSFIDNTITDIGSYQNRMYFLTEENVVMSRTFDYQNFWAASVAAPSDDDPIDSASSDNQITALLHSAVFGGNLVLFSNNAQFIHPKDQTVTPATFAVSADSKYNVSPNIKPVTTGSNIVFPTDFGSFTNVWEYNVNTLTGKPECESTTKHVPRYINGNPVQMVANTTTDYVFMRTDDDPTTIYVYQFYTKDQKRAQLAWHKWDIENCTKIYSITLLGQRLFMVTERDSTVYLEYVDLSLPLTANSDYEIYLDHHYTEQVTTGSYTINGKPYTARFTLQEDDIETFVQGLGGTNPGMRILAYDIDSGYVYCNQPSGAYVIQGYPYTSSGELTNPYVRDGEGRPYTKKTIIEEVSLNVQKTGWLTLTVAHGAGVDYEQDFNGILLNHWQYKLGQASELDTDIYLPVRDYRELVTLTFESDHHLGFNLMSMDWRARLTTRGRRSQ